MKIVISRIIFNSCRHIFIFGIFISNYLRAQETMFPIVTKTIPVSIVFESNSLKLDSISANFLADDIERVTSVRPIVVSDFSKVKGNVIVIGSIQSTPIKNLLGTQSAFVKKLTGKWESFGLTVVNKPSTAVSKALVIAGSDTRGTAFGVFSLSEKIGVSPWYWWADVPVKQKKELVIQQPEYIAASPSVKYRGIFINDEDWGLQPWAAKTFEPETGDIGPKTYAKVFELLLRLKANMIWPAMHPSTKAFFHYPGNLKTAEDYQIIIGSSHAEPMLRNNVGEWNEKSMGHFNYFTNKEKIFKYWEDRIKESRGINAIYTLGMRGVHDGQMEGIKDLKEAVPVLEKIIQEERGMLSKYINQDVSRVPQVLTPYKEVLEIYDNGLKVPDDVTLVWPDDNYGYIHRLNNEKEISREGGAGVYYHVSYWGRPHDYLWISSTHPSLIREEMMKAYETGADRLWVLNVGDIKPLEYNIQLFMDMAYDATAFKESSNTKKHLQKWVSNVFGKVKGREITEILWEYYDLGFQRRPEFMGWNQTEPDTKTKYTEFNHFYFGDEAQNRIDKYNSLEKNVKYVRLQIKANYADAFYQLVYYPVVGASWMNKKFLYRDKAYFYSKQNRLSAYDYAQRSKAAYDSIIQETEYYNQALANGKWKNIMSMKPRNLAVYQAPDLPKITIDSASAWSIAPEGFVTKDSSLFQKNNSFSLPAFDNLNQQKYFIDVFLSKNQTTSWNASVSNNWIHLSQNKGILNSGMRNKQTRIWVDVDWTKFGESGKRIGSIIFTSGGKQMLVNIQASKINLPGLSNYNGFVENNGLVAINAPFFSRQANKRSSQWELIKGLGYTGNSLQVMPLLVRRKSSLEPDSIKLNNAFIEYDFYTFSSTEPTVSVFTLPTHPINNNMGVRYAISIDNGPLKIIDARTVSRSEEWKKNVLRNYAIGNVKLQHINEGSHTLRIYAIDPGVVLDRIVIDLGGLKPAYSVIPQTIQSGLGHLAD